MNDFKPVERDDVNLLIEVAAILGNNTCTTSEEHYIWEEVEINIRTKEFNIVIDSPKILNDRGNKLTYALCYLSKDYGYEIGEVEYN